ncbi:hypothetical protein GNF18_08085 [Ligilactobacillus pobuzihii]|uniref:phage minor head protein n=1 Tax=Ligilactobacillus pobuzihii TaxID=449659 RepID=UPI0019D115E7|nr:phage minor head protein [Ligilactobacillus pobuzihii]MBN7275094.1 hypothetical protein [Ligilactobacillus pobuzihii]
MNIIQLALAEQVDEDKQLRALLEEMNVKHIDVVVEYIRSIGDNLHDILAMDQQQIKEIADRANESNFVQYLPAIWLAMQFSKRGFLTTFEAKISPQLLEFYDRYGQLIAKDFKLDYFPELIAQRKEYESWVDGLGKMMNQSNENTAAKLIRQALAEEKGIDWLAEKLESSGLFKYNRARQTAQTEIFRAYASTDYSSYMANNNVIGFEWNHDSPKTPRENHMAMDGVRIAKGQTFNVGGYEARFPRDYNLPPEESVNCHCFLTPVMVGESL